MSKDKESERMVMGDRKIELVRKGKIRQNENETERSSKRRRIKTLRKIIKYENESGKNQTKRTFFIFRDVFHVLALTY